MSCKAFLVDVKNTVIVAQQKLMGVNDGISTENIRQAETRAQNKPWEKLLRALLYTNLL